MEPEGAHSLMMFAVGGGGGYPKTYDSTEKLCECASDKRERVHLKLLHTSYVDGPKENFDTYEH